MFLFVNITHRVQEVTCTVFTQLYMYVYLIQINYALYTQCSAYIMYVIWPKAFLLSSQSCQTHFAHHPFNSVLWYFHSKTLMVMERALVYAVANANLDVVNILLVCSDSKADSTNMYCIACIC